MSALPFAVAKLTVPSAATVTFSDGEEYTLEVPEVLTVTRTSSGCATTDTLPSWKPEASGAFCTRTTVGVKKVTFTCGEGAAAIRARAKSNVFIDYQNFFSMVITPAE